MKSSAWIVDIDGTLALGCFGEPGRRGPYDWNRVGEDDPNLPVIFLSNALAAFLDIVLVSGRDECCRGETEDWLARHHVSWSALHMRPNQDYRPDGEVKSEIYHRDIVPNWDVLGVLDDRDQVVEMWRGLGLLCCQVAPGAF